MVMVMAIGGHSPRSSEKQVYSFLCLYASWRDAVVSLLTSNWFDYGLDFIETWTVAYQFLPTLSFRCLLTCLRQTLH